MLQLKYFTVFCIAIFSHSLHTEAINFPDLNEFNLTIYYESLCPDSAKLIKEVASVYDYISKIFNVTLIPYGRANVTNISNPFKMECSHGPAECEGDKIHACLLKNIRVDFSLKIKFINCTMNPELNNPNSTEFNATECSKVLQESDFNDVINCSRSGEFENYILEYKSLTEPLFKKNETISIPTVVFNGQYDLTKSKAAVSSFKETVCSLIPLGKPQFCDAKSAGIRSLSVSSLLVLLIAAAHFVK